MMGHKICFNREILLIIPKLSLLPFLIQPLCLQCHVHVPRNQHGHIFIQSASMIHTDQLARKLSLIRPFLDKRGGGTKWSSITNRTCVNKPSTVNKTFDCAKFHSIISFSVSRGNGAKLVKSRSRSARNAI